MTIPVVADLSRVLRRLARNERAAQHALAAREARLRRFEDVERPAYDAWLRLELGPLVTRVEETAAELRGRQMLAERVHELVEDEGLHPREALYVVQEAPPARGTRPEDEPTRDEIAARRRAKLERKRAERKRVKRTRRGGGATAAGPVGNAADGAAHGAADRTAHRRRLLVLYRALARSLHPDSPTVLATLAPARRRTVWAEVQTAYVSRSVERMLALSTWIDTVAASGVDAVVGGHADDPGGSAAVGVLSLAERHERLRALHRSTRALDRRLTELADDVAWEFADASPALRRKLRQAAVRRLESELADGRAALATLDELLAAIGSPRPPRSARRR